MAAQGPSPALGAVNIVDKAAFTNIKINTKIAMSLYEQDAIISHIPFVNDMVMDRKVTYFDGTNMPRVDARDYNEPPQLTKAVPKSRFESASIFSNIIATDRFLEDDKNNFQSPSAFMAQAYMESFKYKTQDVFFNNSHDGQLDHDKMPVGLRARILASDLPGSQNAYGVQPGLNMNAGVDMSPTNLATGGGNKGAAIAFITALARGLTNLGAPTGKGVYIYANEQFVRQATACLFYLGAGAGFGTDTDNYGKSFMTFREARIVDVGRKDDMNTFVISPYLDVNGKFTTGTPTGAAYGQPAQAGKNYTECFFVRYGENYFSGWKWYDFGPDAKRRNDPGTFYSWLFDNALGWGQVSTRSIARMYGFKVQDDAS